MDVVPGPKHAHKPAKQKPGKPHTPQRQGGKKRLASHSGNRLNAQTLKNRLAEKQEVIDALRHENMALRDQSRASQHFVVFAQRKIAALTEEIAQRDAQREAFAQRLEGQLQRERQNTEAAEVRVRALADRVQSLSLDVEWLSGLRQERVPPDSRLRRLRQCKHSP